MDLKTSLDYRTSKYTQFNDLGNTAYNYGKYGILNKSIPKILFKGNYILVSFLQLTDMRFVMLFKYIDKLKHFKHITWY